MDPFSLKTLNAERRARRAAILVTDLGDGRDRVVKEGDTVAGLLGEAVAKAFRSGRSGTVEIGGRVFFLNANLPSPRLVVIGAGQISQALAAMAGVAGYSVEIIDPRAGFATAERFAGIRASSESPEVAFRRSPLDPYCALAALTHEPQIDDPALKAALESGCFFVGALGSRKTHASRLERLAKLGVSQVALDRIRGPIGLDIGAANPAEIAVSILAQVIESFRKRGNDATA